ncbi:MAG: hypothetical protein JWM47_3098 [Acidimicrobiales bacterium]|nr:hypothetical protein [Acidimicrobiales bacterium]
MMSHIRRGLFLAAGALALGALPGLPAAVAAPVRPMVALPRISLNTTHLAVGTELTVTGTGCLDVASGSATGYRVGIVFAPRAQPNDPNSITPVSPPTFDVDPDGSWEFTTTIAQPLPPGPSDLVARCFDDPNDFGSHALYESVPVSITLPPLTGVQVQGDTITADYPCDLGTRTPLGASFLYNGELLVVTLTDVTVDEAGTTVTIQVPAEQVPSGTYQLVATCGGNRGSGTEAAFAASVKYAAHDPVPATSAEPVEGSPSFTG